MPVVHVYFSGCVSHVTLQLQLCWMIQRLGEREGLQDLLRVIVDRNSYVLCRERAIAALLDHQLDSSMVPTQSLRTGEQMMKRTGSVILDLEVTLADYPAYTPA